MARTFPWLGILALVAAGALGPLPAGAEAPYGVIGLGGSVMDRPNKAELADARAALLARAAVVRSERLAADGTASVRSPGSLPADERVGVCQQLLAQYPDDPRACKWQERVALDALAVGDLDRQARELLHLHNQGWRVRASEHPSAVQRACRQASEALLRPFAILAHEAFMQEQYQVPVTGKPRAQAAPPSPAFLHAERAYEASLRSTTRRDVDTRTRFFLAGLLRERAWRLFDGQSPEARALHRRAAEVYRGIIDNDPHGASAEAAAYARILMVKEVHAFDETIGQGQNPCQTDDESICVIDSHVRRPWEDPLRQAEHPRPEIPYSAADVEMLAAYADYVRVTPHTSPDRQRVLFLSAYLKLRRNHLDEARVDFEALLRDHDGTAHAAWSAELLLGLLAARWRAPGSTPARRQAAAADLATALAWLPTTRSFSHDHAALARWTHARLQAWHAEERALAAHAAGFAGDRAGHLRCAGILVAAVEGARRSIAPLEHILLDQAATCYRAAGRPVAAFRARVSALEERDDRAVYERSIDDLLAAGRFERAARRMAEQRGYPGDARTAAWLGDAYRIYLGLGEADEADDVLARYARLGDPRQTAELAWARHTSLTGDDERLASVRGFLAVHRNAARDLRALATAELGGLLWRRACPVATDHGLCVDLDALPAATCAGPRPALRVHDRAPALAGEALRHLRRAVALARAANDRDRLVDATALARLYLADALLESALRRGSDVRPSRRRYAAISATGASPRWTLAARARLALAAAVAPAEVGCDALEVADACLAHSYAHGRDDGASRLCRRLSGQRSSEIVGDASYTTSRPESIGLQHCTDPFESYDTCEGRWLAWPASADGPHE